MRRLLAAHCLLMIDGIRSRFNVCFGNHFSERFLSLVPLRVFLIIIVVVVVLNNRHTSIVALIVGLFIIFIFTLLSFHVKVCLLTLCLTLVIGVGGS